MADLAGHVDVRQEVHLDLDLAVALAGLAAAAGDVEREAPGAVAARAALRQRREEGAQVVPEPDVGGRVGARGAADGRLVDVDDLVDELDALELLVGAHGALGAVHGIGERRRDGIRDQRALARTRDARDHREGAELDLGTYVAKVVGTGTGDLDRALARVAARVGKVNLALAREVGSRDGVGAGGDLVRRARGHDLAAKLSRTRAHVDHVVGGADGVLVVLDHDDGVALVAQALQGLDQAVVVALMQADRGLVQDVEHAHEAGADLGGKADALGLATGERGGRTREREVVQAHVHEKAQARQDLLHHRAGDEALAVGELKGIEEGEALPAGELADLPDVLLAHRDGQDLRLEARPVAGGAGHLSDVLLEVRAHGVGGGLLVLVEEDLAHAGKGGEPVRVAAVAREVVHAHLGGAKAVEKGVLNLLGKVAPRRVLRGAQVAAHGGKHLRIVV